METDRHSKTDDKYINKIALDFYHREKLTEVQNQFVHMGGKSHYNSPKVRKEIKELTKYSLGVRSVIVYCFDTDHYDTNAVDEKALREEKEYCGNNGYEFVWHCHDIEEVFFGKSAKNSTEKIQLAKKFYNQIGITSELYQRLNCKQDYLSGHGNLIVVLKEIFQKKDRPVSFSYSVKSVDLESHCKD